MQSRRSVFVAVGISWAVLVLSAAFLLRAAHGAEEPLLPEGGERSLAAALTSRETAGEVQLGDARIPAEEARRLLGDALARDPVAARAVLDHLKQVAGTEADLLRAEMLFRCARAFRVRRETPQEWVVMPTDEVGRRAGTLLDHGDPLVRALAEWAIDLRLSTECEGDFPRPWPDPVECAWYARWLALPDADILDLDYMRRAYVLGQARTAEDLLQGAQEGAQAALHVARRAEADSPVGRRRPLAEHVTAMGAALAELEALAAETPPRMTALRRQYVAFCRSRRRVVMSNPDIDFGEIIFGVRNGNDANNITQGDLLDIFGAEGELYIKDGIEPDSPVRPLLRGRLGPGHLRGLDLWFDADRIVFSFVEQPAWDEILRERAERYERELADGAQRRVLDGIRGLNDAKGTRSRRAHLWEMDLHSGELRQLTDAPYNDDYEPAYLPNGDIAFTSDRSNYGSQCAGNPGQDKMIINLYRCAGDGTNIRPLSNNKDFDRFPRATDEGNLMYLHWEYQERHLYLPHTLWQSRPDGTGADALYKQHLPHTPMSLRDARKIPGASKLVGIACGHHVGAVGSVFLVNYGMGINEGDAMRHVTPDVSPTEWNYGPWGAVQQGGVRDSGGYYHYPYPLSDNSFLASYSYNRSASHARARSYALYYIDVWGNKELIHRDRRMSVTYGTPLRRRPLPPVVPDVVDESRGEAYVYVNDVHEGLEGVERGTVKYIRVAQHLPWPCVRDLESGRGIAFNDIHYNPAGPWTTVLGINGWSPARSIGIVPVEEDGSAHFKVPVRQPVYFQALDENLMEVRRMRSNVTFQPGELRGCIGCHETRAVAPRQIGRPAPLAVTREPSMPEPPPWGSSQPPDFEQHIQPILDAGCVSCHGQENPAGGIELTGREIGGYNQSYRSMFGLKATDPTPARDFYIRMWQKDKPNFSSEGNREWFKKCYANELPGQMVAIADYKSGAEVTEPYQFGSTQSRLVTTLLNDPAHRNGVPLTADEWRALVTWIDLNAFYYSTYTYFDAMERVPVRWPDPWERAPAGEWLLREDETGKHVVLQP